MFATEAEAIQEWVWSVGHERADCAWLVSSYDTWERNPYYRGPEVPHPEVAYEDAQAEAYRLSLQNKDGVDMVSLCSLNEYNFKMHFEVCANNGCIEEIDEIPF